MENSAPLNPVNFTPVVYLTGMLKVYKCIKICSPKHFLLTVASNCSLCLPISKTGSMNCINQSKKYHGTWIFWTKRCIRDFEVHYFF